MAPWEEFEMLRHDVMAWNEWRLTHPGKVPIIPSGVGLIGANLAKADLNQVSLRGLRLMGASLTDANLREADLSFANLTGANLSGVEAQRADLACADLAKANLEKANFNGANFTAANLAGANLARASLCEARFLKAVITQANLAETNLMGAILSEANLTGAIMRGASLVGAVCVRTILENADLTGCTVYGLSAWDVALKGAKQNDLVITPYDDTAANVTVDNLAVAQFMHLLLNNATVRGVIDTVTSRVVLILGRFSSERKAVLDALRKELRDRGLIPVLFDFERPASKDRTGVVEILARMARIVIADLTDSSSVPHELATIIPHLRTTPVVSLRLKGTTGYSMFDDLLAYDRWVLPVHYYQDEKTLIADLAKVLGRAEKRLKQLRG